MSKNFVPRRYSMFADADAFLNGGRNKNVRTIQNNTQLRRVSEDDIAVVLHRTAVVTYHRDGTQTIYGGGWNTVTTKDRISSYSAVNPGSNGEGMWVIGHTGAKTPAKVQKCRSCSRQNPLKDGKSTWTTDDYCNGPGWWDYCQGGEIAYAVPLTYTKVQTLDGGEETVSNSDEWYASRYTAPCQHGETKRHAFKPCSHGSMVRHAIGRSEKHCYGCNGEGVRDYGSKDIPILVGPDAPFTVDHFGNLTAKQPPRGFEPDVYAMRYVKPARPSKRKLSAFEWEMGTEMTDAVYAVTDSLKDVVRNPSSGTYEPIETVVLTLHDTHHWSDERICAWLDTLS